MRPDLAGGIRAWMTQRPGIILLAATGGMLAVLLCVSRWMLFWWDDWQFVFERPDPSPHALLAPVFDTLAAVPVLVYQGLLATFGLRTYLPFLLVAWLAHFAVAFLLYRIVRRRSGVVIGLAAGISLLFLGTGFEVLLQPFQIQYLFAFVGGLFAIDQLDNDRPLPAAAALVPAVASSGLGVILAGTVLTWGLLRRHRPTVLAALPAILLYGAWYLSWGQESQRLPGTPLGIIDGAYSTLLGLGAAMAGIIGLPLGHFPLIGLGIELVGVLAVAAIMVRGYRPNPLMVAALAGLIGVQVLRVVLRGPYGVEYGATRSGYVYIGAVFLWLAAGSLPSKPLANTKALRMAAVVLIAPMAILNMLQFAAAATHDRNLRATELADLRLIESLRSDPRLDPNAHLDDVGAISVRVDPYLAAIDRFGRPDLAYDWKPYVDEAAVAMARQRLLPGAAR